VAAVERAEVGCSKYRTFIISPDSCTHSRTLEYRWTTRYCNDCISAGIAPLVYIAFDTFFWMLLIFLNKNVIILFLQITRAKSVISNGILKAIADH
jgi:hypothetical protein